MASDLLDIVQDKVRACTSCWLHTAGNGPVPYRGPIPAPIVVVGEAPGQTEDTQGEPFVGKAGKALTEMLKVAHINPDRYVGFCNVVSCWPGRGKGGKGFRVPDLAERDACSTNLRLQVAAAQPEVVVLLGATALNTFRPDMKISKDRGRPLVIEGFGRVVVPTYHPSAVVRAKHLGRFVERDLKQVRWRWKKEGDGPGWERWPDDCRKCHRPVAAYDENGVAWCAAHAPDDDAVTGVPMTLGLESPQ